MAKNKFNKDWLNDHLNDPYVKMAQREGYRARAAYKLKEIDEQDRLIGPGMVVVDLGSTPGSWSQYARNRLVEFGKKNRINGTPTMFVADGTRVPGAIEAAQIESLLNAVKP